MLQHASQAPPPHTQKHPQLLHTCKQNAHAAEPAPMHMYILIMPRRLTSHYTSMDGTLWLKSAQQGPSAGSRASLSAPSPYVRPPTDPTTPPSVSSTSRPYSRQSYSSSESCHHQEDQHAPNLSAAHEQHRSCCLSEQLQQPNWWLLPALPCSEQRIHLCPARVLCCLQRCPQLPSQRCCQWGRHCIAHLPVPVVHGAAELEAVREALQAQTAAAAAGAAAASTGTLSITPASLVTTTVSAKSQLQSYAASGSGNWAVVSGRCSLPRCVCTDGIAGCHL